MIEILIALLAILFVGAFIVVILAVNDWED